MVSFCWFKQKFDCGSLCIWKHMKLNLNVLFYTSHLLSPTTSTFFDDLHFGNDPNCDTVCWNMTSMDKSFLIQLQKHFSSIMAVWPIQNGRYPRKEKNNTVFLYIQFLCLQDQSNNLSLSNCQSCGPESSTGSPDSPSHQGA